VGNNDPDVKFVWRQLDQLPSIFDLKDVWVDSSGEAVAIGPDGLLVNWTGEQWITEDIETGQDLWAVYGTTRDDIMVVGDYGTIMAHAPIRWTPLTSGTTENLRGVWGSAADNFIAVGDAGTILHYDGVAWSRTPSPILTALFDVWGSSRDDIFAVGIGGTILHYDGSDWSQQASGTTELLAAVCGTGPDDVFAVGNHGIILHYDGATWSQQISGTADILQTIWPRSSSRVFTAGANGVLLTYDGTSWSSNDDVTDRWIYGMAGSGNVGIAVGSRLLFRYADENWRIETRGAVRTLNSVWQAGNGDVYAAGRTGTIVRMNDDEWQPMESVTRRELRAIWGTSGANVYAVGEARVLHFDGISWNSDTVPVAEYRDIWGSSADDVYTVGDNGLILHSNGDGNWTAKNSGVSQDLYGIWGPHERMHFVVGEGGRIIRFTGNQYVIVVVRELATMRALTGHINRDDELVAIGVGDGGASVRYTEEFGWVKLPANTQVDFTTIAVSPGGVFVAVADGGTLWQLDNSDWLPLSSPTTQRIGGIWISPSSEMYIAGGDGELNGFVFTYGPE